MKGIIDALPAVREIDMKIGAERERERRVIGRLSADESEYQDELARWRKGADEALERGERFDDDRPQEPSSRGPGQAFLGRIRAEIESLQKQRHRAILSAAAMIDEKAAAVVAKEVEKAGPLLDQLAEIVSAIRAAQRAVSQIAASRNAADPNVTRPMRHVPPLDIEGLRFAVERDVDLLAEHREIHSDARSHRNSAAPEPPVPPAPSEPDVELVAAPQGGLEPARRKPTGRDRL